MRGRGRSRELELAKRMRAEGWVVYRLSEGPADLAAFKRGEVPELVQVKSNVGNPYMHFRPDEREKLTTEAWQAGARPLLAHWPPRGRLRIYRASEWPLSEKARAVA